VADWWLSIGSVNIVLRNDDVGVGFCFSFWRLPFTVHSCVLRLASCVLRVVVEWFAGRESRAPSALLLRAEIIILTAWAIAWGWLDDGGTMAGRWHWEVDLTE
jgi:hypothetical protein